MKRVATFFIDLDEGFDVTAAVVGSALYVCLALGALLLVVTWPIWKPMAIFAGYVRKREEESK